MWRLCWGGDKQSVVMVKWFYGTVLTFDWNITDMRDCERGDWLQKMLWCDISVRYSDEVCQKNDSTMRLMEQIEQLVLEMKIYSVSQKNPPYGFLKFFPKRLGIFNQFFTHLLYYHLYTRLQIFIQISLTMTKLCHTKRDHLAKFYISLEL